MSRPRLRVEQLMVLGRQGRRVTVACSATKSSLGIAPPTTAYLAEALPLLKAAVLYQHEDEHPGCDTERLWSAHGLQQIRTTIDQAWDAAVAEKLRELAN